MDRKPSDDDDEEAELEELNRQIRFHFGRMHARRARSVLGAMRARREELIEIAAKHGARDLRVFGSVARGEEREGSDIDLLVTFDPGCSLLDLSALNAELVEALGRPVDVCTDRELTAAKSPLRERILRDLVEL